MRRMIITLALLCLLVTIPVSYCQPIKFYKLYIGPWGVPPSEYIDLDSPGSISESLRQDLRSIVEALLNLGCIMITSENAQVYQWISSLNSDRFNVLYNNKYYRVLIISEEYVTPTKTIKPIPWIIVTILVCYSAATTLLLWKKSRR